MKQRTGLLALAFIAASTTYAASVAPVSDILTVYDSNSTIVGQLTLREDGTWFGLHAACNGPTCGTLEDSANLYYLDLPTLSLVNTSTPTMVLESANVGSDVFGVTNLGFGYTVLSFRSDGETVQFIPGAGYTLVPEGNGNFDLTSYIQPGLGYTATFYSDPAETPEPGTAALLAGGILVMAWGRKQSKG